MIYELQTHTNTID